MPAVTFDLIARDRASRVFNNVGNSAQRTGKSFSTVGRLAGSALGGVGVVAAFGKAISSAKDFDLTMRQVGVQTKQSGDGLKALSALAIKMGRDTVFSASDASQAMLGLAKAGLSSATIQGGALQSTLTLASAGGLDLASSATFMSNALNTFGLRAKSASKVAAALAGGANASTASVESLGLALSQVGPGARNAGVSLQETVAVLSAFDQAGIKGSDAGTSLKTMLQRLVPQTDKAKAAMKDLGLKFTDAHGEFLPIAAVAQQLQNRLGKLTPEVRSHALATIFGSDATRAATVLMNLGSKGVKEYTKATSDLTAAEKLAKTNTDGASGAWENFKGTLETLTITAGTKLLPTFTKMVGGLTSFFNALTTGQIKGEGFNGTMSTLGANTRAFGQTLTPVAKALGDVARFLVGLPGPVLAAAAAFVVAKTAVSGVTGKLNELSGSFTKARGASTGLTGIAKGLSGVVGGPWTLALTAGLGILGTFAARHAAAKAKVESMTAALDKETFAVTELNRSQVASELQQNGTFAAARTLGIGLKDLTNAALGNVAAQKRVRAATDGVHESLTAQGKGALDAQHHFRRLTAADVEAVQAARKVTAAVSGTNERLRESKARAAELKEALGGLGDAGAKAGRQFTDGLVRGLRQGGAVAVSVAVGIANRINAQVNSAKGFDSSSPSKKGKKSGRQYIEGIAVGMKDATRTALDAARSMADRVSNHLNARLTKAVDRLKTLKDAAAAAFSTGAAGVGGFLDLSQIGAPVETTTPGRSIIDPITGAVTKGADVTTTSTPSTTGLLAGFAGQATAFAAALGAMAKKKLPLSLITAIAGSGNLAAAQSLAALSGADLTSAKASLGQIATAQGQAGGLLSKLTVDPRLIKAASDQVGGLRKLDHQLDKVIKKLGDLDKDDEVSVKIKGDDLYVVMKRVEKKNKRRG